LQIAGVAEVKGKDGKPIAWKRDLANKLFALQQPDGSWVNEVEGRWMEKDPILATCYCVYALQFIQDGL